MSALDHDAATKAIQTAFLQASAQITKLFEAAEQIIQQQLKLSTPSSRIKLDGINSSVSAISNLFSRLGDDIMLARRGELRALSQRGLEVELVNELLVNADALALLIVREHVSLASYIRQDLHLALKTIGSAITLL